jgi:hypothetical protein
MNGKINANTNKLANVAVNGITTTIGGTLMLGTSPATTNVGTTLTDYNSRITASINKLANITDPNGTVTTISNTLMIGTTNVGTALTEYDLRISANANKLANISINKDTTSFFGVLMIGTTDVGATLTDLIQELLQTQIN